MTAEVVVVGYGPAGAAAAIAAHDAGAHVTVLESAPRGGGNAVYSGGFLFDVPGGAAVDHIDALSFGRTPREVLASYAGGLADLPEWLASLGATLETFDPPAGRLPASFPSWPHLPAGTDIRYRVVAGGDGRRGEALWEALDTAVRRRDVDVRTDTAVRRLALDDDGVVGVVLPDGDALPAAAVVLACGGFEGDRELADSYLPLGPTWPVGTPHNDGAGLRMAQQVGAALWHMYGCFGWFALRVPEYTAPFAVDFFAPTFVMLDADGERFADETGYEVHDRLRALLTYLPRNRNKPALPTWAVFDEATRTAGPLNGLLGSPNDYTWSQDNSVEVERGGSPPAQAPPRWPRRPASTSAG